ncbi:MAG: SCE4755 family polysaccharide monooxygenase-like protein [Pseudobdellovibrio sp.]
MVKKLIFVITLLFMTEMATAHSRWSLTGNTPPRDNSTGLKSAPCGGLPRGSAPKVFQAGSTITVQWEETIQHPGHFEFYYSQANDANFTLLKTVADTQDDQNTPHEYSTTLTLPNINCSGCTLQLIQVMTENPAAPTNYYSCSDIQLTGSTATTPPVTTPPTSGTGTVSGTTTNDCAK